MYRTDYFLWHSSISELIQIDYFIPTLPYLHKFTIILIARVHISLSLDTVLTRLLVHFLLFPFFLNVSTLTNPYSMLLISPDLVLWGEGGGKRACATS